MSVSGGWGVGGQNSRNTIVLYVVYYSQNLTTYYILQIYQSNLSDAVSTIAPHLKLHKGRCMYLDCTLDNLMFV